MINPDNHIFHQLISNKDFVLWVNQPNEDRDIFWQNWSYSNAFAQDQVLKAREFIQRLQFREDLLSTEELDGMLGKILEREACYLPVAAERPVRIGSWAQKQWLRVAAILLLSLLIGASLERINPTFDTDQVVLQAPLKKVDNPRGIKSSFLLPDGTKVHLNYESSLTFPPQFEHGERKVSLVGEAFFDVVHSDSVPFVVLAEGVAVQVLGTSFNVSSSNYQTQVSLVKGKVLVNFLDQHTGLDDQMLTPGNQIHLDRRLGKYTVTPFQTDQITGWKDGIMMFEDAGMADFFERLEKWYGVNIQIFGRPAKPWKINGRYENEMLEDILLGLKFVYNIEYQLNGKNVWIKIND
nr:DUF4974 domain-containing protein [Cytophagales bacterium]